MEDLTVKRFEEYEGSTVSNLSFDGVDYGYSLEDGHNDPKVPGETRIPAGRYKLGLRKVGGFNKRYTDASWIPEGVHKGMIEILDVPGFTYILFHTGNTKEHTDGCILCGAYFEKKGEDGFFVGSSRKTYLRIYPKIVGKLIAGEDVYITITDPQKQNQGNRYA